MNYGEKQRNKNSLKIVNQFSLQILTEHFLCTKHGSRSWGDDNEHNKHDFYPHGPGVVGETHFNKSLHK